MLKRHVTAKHKKQKLSTPEKERTSTINDSLNISTPIEERTEDTSLSLPLHFEEIDTPSISELPVQERENETSIDSPPKATEHIPPIPTFKCHLCSFEGTHSFALEAHLTFVHNETIPNTTYTCHICNDIFKNSESFKNHMTHELHHFYDGTDVCANCRKPNEVGLYYLESWDAVLMTCKDCVQL